MRTSFPGEVGVTLEIVRPGEFAALVRVEDRLRVKLGADLMTQLEAVLGPGSVRLSRSA